MANRKSKYTNIIFVIFLSFGIGLLFSQSTTTIRIIKAFVYYVVYQNIVAVDMVASQTGVLADSVKSLVYVHQENLQYKNENQELIDKLRNYEEIKKEYDRLINLLRVPPISFTKSVIASIAIREPSEWYQWIIISKGTNDGLYDGLAIEVLNQYGQLCVVGRIVETYTDSAKIALITNLLSAIPVKIRGYNINCLAEGTNTKSLNITYIPIDADVSVGDEVVISGLSSVFAEDTPVAVIKSVTKGSATDFKSAVAEIYFEAEMSREVIVLIPQKERS